MPSPARPFEEFTVGLRLRSSGTVTITAERIKSFAAEFDPQPPHVDEAAAAASLFGGLVASGWHTGAVAMRLVEAMLALMETMSQLSVYSIPTFF